MYTVNVHLNFKNIISISDTFLFILKQQYNILKILLK